MEKTDIIIIGAGMVGLAVAYQLSGTGREIIVLEKHESFGREASSRNSEVVHAGIYYPQNTLKAELCVRGNRLLYELLEKHELPYKKCGKIIVAETEDEEQELLKLLENGNRNGVSGLKMISKNEVEHLEPDVIATTGLFSPETGIVDTHSLMSFYEKEAENRGVMFAYDHVPTGIEFLSPGFRLEVREPSGEIFQIQADSVINSAGLGSEDVAAMAGLNIDELGYKLHPCKGEYFRISNRHKGKISHLIYPAPTRISLGLHLVLELDGGLKLGPNAFYVDDIDYDVDISHKLDFLESGKKYLNFLKEEDLSPDQAGIRPKLQLPTETFRDFVIKDEKDNGLPGFVNLIGIESPGLTAAPAIAEHVESLIN